MTVYLTGSELASYLDKPESNALTRIANLVNGLIDDEWANPVDPVPARVLTVAWNVATRAGANPKGLSSFTKSWDDITNTERWEQASAAGVFLTDDELAKLNGAVVVTRRVKSVRMMIPGWREPCGY